MTRTRVALALLIAVPVLWFAGPSWPGGRASLLCGPQNTLRAELRDRAVCEAALTRTRDDCRCDVRRGEWSAIYYLGLLPAIPAIAIPFLRPQVLIGMSAVLSIVVAFVFFIPTAMFIWYLTGLRMPLLAQGLLIGVPQLFMFLAILETPWGKAIPYEYAEFNGALAWIAWLMLGYAFGFAVLKLRSPVVMIALAVAYVAAIVMGLLFVAPSYGFRLRPEYP